MNVLIAEQDADSIKRITSLCHQLGHCPVLSQDADELMREIQTYPPFKVILVNWNSLNSNPAYGKVMKLLQTQDKNLRHYIIAMLGKRTSEPASDLAHVGIDDVLPSFFGVEALESRLLVASRMLKLREEVHRAKYREQANARMITLGQAGVDIVHEISAPLTLITGYIEKMRVRILSPDFKDDRLRKELLEAMEKTDEMTRRIYQIGRFMRAAYRGERSGTDTVFTVVSLIWNALGICAERFREMGVAIPNPEIDPALRVNGREEELCQVILNLLWNALDAIEDEEEKWIRLEIKQCEERVDIFIIDSGKGIPPEIRQKMMDRYFTTKPENRGTGLGLSIANDLVIRHGGLLEYDTTQKNTCFVVRLPLAFASL